MPTQPDRLARRIFRDRSHKGRNKYYGERSNSLLLKQNEEEEEEEEGLCSGRFRKERFYRLCNCHVEADICR
jgi:hypothetical protein